MLSRFPCSWEAVWRGTSATGLRTRCVLAALLTIVYSVCALGAVLSAWWVVPARVDADTPPAGSLLLAAAAHLLACLLSALMVAGVLRDVLCLVRPWLWLTWLQICAGAVSLMLSALTAAPASLHYIALQFLIILVRLCMVTVVGSYCRLLQEGAAERERLAERLRDPGYTLV